MADDYATLKRKEMLARATTRMNSEYVESQKTLRFHF